jgi:hypothetical protein
MAMLCRMCVGNAEAGVSLLDPTHQQILQWTINTFQIEVYMQSHLSQILKSEGKEQKL